MIMKVSLIRQKASLVYKMFSCRLTQTNTHDHHTIRKLKIHGTASKKRGTLSFLVTMQWWNDILEVLDYGVFGEKCSFLENIYQCDVKRRMRASFKYRSKIHTSDQHPTWAIGLFERHDLLRNSINIYCATVKHVGPKSSTSLGQYRLSLRSVCGSTTISGVQSLRSCPVSERRQQNELLILGKLASALPRLSSNCWWSSSFWWAVSVISLTMVMPVVLFAKLF